MNEITLSADDVVQHVVTIGLDIFPPIEMRNERTRLNMFFEDVRERWGDIYETLTVGESEFKISKPFREKPDVRDPTFPVDSFVLTPRGPVFVFPLRLPDPVGFTKLEGRYKEIFTEVRKALWSRLPGHKVLRVGLIREVLFLTGETDCTFLVSGQPDWLGARLTGGQRLFQYQDDKCNIRLEFGPGRLSKVTQLPVGKKVGEPVGFGIKVKLDINNTELRELQDADIEEVLERAIGFWPDELLQYLSRVK